MGTTNVTLERFYRDDDYFEGKNSPVSIYRNSSSGGTPTNPADFYTRTALDGGQLNNLYYTETEADARFVRLTTNQTIAGIKTFSSVANFSAGISVTGNVIATGEVESYDTSDIELKENIEELDKEVTTFALMCLRAIRYDHKLKKKREIGLIAQEVKEFFPEVVKPHNKGYLMINYGKLIPVLVAAFQKQQHEIDELKRRIK